MATEQPKWKIVGHVGDIDPIAYGGGFIYEDETGVYPPEMSYFVPAPDEDWNKTQGATPLKIHRILLEKDSESEWWYKDLDKIATISDSQTQICGNSVKDLQRMLLGSVTEKAFVYMFLIEYFGAENFDDNPETMTEDEAYEKYAEEMKFVRRPKISDAPTT